MRLKLAMALLLIAPVASLAQVNSNAITVIPKTDLSAAGTLAFRDIAGAKITITIPTTLTNAQTLVLPGAIPVAGNALVVSTVVGSTVTLGWGTGGSGSSPPFADNAPLIKDNLDATKTITIDASGIATATNRTLTAQNANYIIAGIDLAQTWTADQTFRNVLYAADNTYTLGAPSSAASIGYSHIWRTEELDLTSPGGSFATFWKLARTGTSTMDITHNANTIIHMSDGLTVEQVVVRGDLLPNLNTTWELGDPSQRWTGIYGQTLDVTGAATVGSVAWQGTSITAAISGGSLNVGGTSGLTITPSGSVTMRNGSLLTNTSGAWAIGANATPWGQLYVNSIGSVGTRALVFASNVNIGGTVFTLTSNPDLAGDLIPTANNTYQLGCASCGPGSARRAFSTVFAQDLNITGSAGTSIAINGGNFWGRVFTGGAPSCAGVPDGWQGFNTTNKQLYACAGGTEYHTAAFTTP